MGKITKKQKQEFAKIYVGSQMLLVDTGNIGNIVEDSDNINLLIEEINLQGRKILKGREVMVDPVKILE